MVNTFFSYGIGIKKSVIHSLTDKKIVQFDDSILFGSTLFEDAERSILNTKTKRIMLTTDRPIQIDRHTAMLSISMLSLSPFAALHISQVPMLHRS